MSDRSFSNARAITPSDTIALAFTTSALGVTVSGTVMVDMAGGMTTQLTLPVGITPVRVTKIYATGTAATGLVAYW